MQWSVLSCLIHLLIWLILVVFMYIHICLHVHFVQSWPYRSHPPWLSDRCVFLYSFILTFWSLCFTGSLVNGKEIFFFLQSDDPWHLIGSSNPSTLICLLDTISKACLRFSICPSFFLLYYFSFSLFFPFLFSKDFLSAYLHSYSFLPGVEVIDSYNTLPEVTAAFSFIVFSAGVLCV